MQYCQKISGGRSPPINTKAEWENLTREVDLITQDRSSLPFMWTSATEGDKNGKLAGLDHWPETEVVQNETQILKAVETMWRDFYTGQKLDNWIKTYNNELSRKDALYGDTYNCMEAWTNTFWEESLHEWQCYTFGMSCPCSYPTQPLLRLRGLCKN